MKRRKDRGKPLSKHPLFFLGLGLFLVAAGALTLAQGQIHHTNYRDELVFAPFIILVGLICFVAAFRQRRRAR
jgi:uncharacterized membrane protein HdeD (DUF308 family)